MFISIRESSFYQLYVFMEFPRGVYITTSNPDYRNGWDISIEPSGLIDNKYRLLFYECKIPDLWQYEKIWMVPRDSIEIFFKSDLLSAGFTGPKSRILEPTGCLFSSLLNIYHQIDSQLEEIVAIKFSVPPDHVRRLFNIVSEYSSSMDKLSTTVVTSFDRVGFVVVEWGVVWKLIILNKMFLFQKA